MTALYTHIEDYDGFTITAQAFNADHSVIDAGYNDGEALQAKVDSGDLQFFRVQVTASLNGHIQGAANLGGCLYDDFNDFLKISGYYEDMREEVLEKAKALVAA